jgi:hypothetical protein
MLFPDDMDDSPLPARPIARSRSAVAPSDRRMEFSPGVPPRGFRADHVAIPVRPIVPTVFVPRARVEPPIPGFYDPTGRKLRTSPSAFRINPDSIVKSPLRRTKKAGRGRRSKGKFTRHKARRFRSRKA